MPARAILLLAAFALPGPLASSAPAPTPRKKDPAEQNRANLAKLAEALRGSSGAELKLIIPAGRKYAVPLQGRTLFYSSTGRPSDTTRAVTGSAEGGGLWVLGSKPGT